MIAFFGVLLVLVVLVVLARGLHPVSFPNLEVKPFCADGTATGGLWESRALPTVSWWWGCLILVGLTPPPLCFVLFVVCLGGGVTPRFLCVYGALAVKGSQRHACR